MSITIIAKNVGGSTLDISDLGISIVAGTQRSLYPEFSLEEISLSTVLKTYINNASIVINDGTADLSIANAIKHVSIETEYEDDISEVQYVAYNGVAQTQRNTINFTGSGVTVSDAVAGTIVDIQAGGSAATSVIEVVCTTSTTNLNSATPTPIPWDSEIVKDSRYTHSNVTNNSRITVNTTGLYRVTYNISIDCAGEAAPQIRMRIGGNTYIGYSTTYGYARSNSYSIACGTISFLHQFTGGQYFELMGNRTGGSQSSNTIGNECSCIVELVR